MSTPRITSAQHRAILAERQRVREETAEIVRKTQDTLANTKRLMETLRNKDKD